MPAVDVSDDTFVAAAPERVAADVSAGRPWQAGLRSLRLRTALDRGVRGRHWWASARRGGRSWAGTAEIWLEPWHDGTVVHLYVRLDPCRRPVELPGRWPDAGAVACPAVRARARAAGGSRAARRLRARLTRAWKRSATEWKDELEGGRRPGTPAGTAAGAASGGARSPGREPRGDAGGGRFGPLPGSRPGR